MEVSGIFFYTLARSKVEMEIFITLFYALLFCFIIYRFRFFEIPSFPKKFIIGVFLLKAISAILFGIIHLHYYGVIDTFIYFEDSKGVYLTLFENPLAFLRLLFGPSDLGLNVPFPPLIFPFLEKYNITYWGHFYESEYMVIRFLTIFNLFTFGYYYADAVFMAFVSLIGLLYVYRIIADLFSEKTFLIKIALFGIPSVMFFTSGIHKEALAVFFIGILLWNFHKIIGGEIGVKRISLVIISGFLLYTLREFVMLFLLPNLIAYYWCMQNRKNIIVKFIFTHLIFWTLVFNIYRLDKQFDIAKNIVHKQKDFFLLKGNSFIEINKLEPNFISFLKNSPQALRNTLVYPLYWQSTNSFQKFTSLETTLVLLIIIVSLFFLKIEIKNIHPFILFCFMFSISLLILFGLIVPNLGALARYKSIPIPFLLLSFLMLVNEKKLSETLNYFKKHLKI